jgi:HSP20 family molecular chaperone IbpA
VAERTRSDIFGVLDAFERDLDSLFDDLLITRWRSSSTRATDQAGPAPRRRGRAARTEVIDRSDHYEVHMAQLSADRTQIDIEASDRRLVVRSIEATGAAERIVEFKHPIDPEAATASVADDGLTIILPKRPSRKIRLA